MSNEVTVKVQADLSVFTQATVEDIAAVVAEHVAGDQVTVHTDPLSVCTNAATSLSEQFYILPK